MQSIFENWASIRFRWIIDYSRSLNIIVWVWLAFRVASVSSFPYVLQLSLIIARRKLLIHSYSWMIDGSIGLVSRQKLRICATRSVLLHPLLPRGSHVFKLLIVIVHISSVYLWASFWDAIRLLIWCASLNVSGRKFYCVGIILALISRTRGSRLILVNILLRIHQFILLLLPNVGFWHFIHRND